MHDSNRININVLITWLNCFPGFIVFSIDVLISLKRKGVDLATTTYNYDENDFGHIVLGSLKNFVLIFGVMVEIKFIRIYMYIFGWTENVEHYNDHEEFVDINEIGHIYHDELYSI